MPRKQTEVILFGVGSIGAEIARVIANRPGYEIVAAVDTDPAKSGRDLGQVVGFRERLGIVVTNDAKSALKKHAQVVVHSTGSYLREVKPQIEMIVNARHNVISTSEELAEAWSQNESDARTLDELAKEREVSILGAGVNPGFIMDVLPVMLTGMCQTVRKVRVKRVVDASRRRLQMQKKIGAGLTAMEFRERTARREIRHVGLTESLCLIARALEWDLDGHEETIEPLIATHPVRTDFLDVPPNFVTGVRQTCVGVKGGQRLIELELLMSVDSGPSVDEAWIEGVPNIHSRVDGINSEVSTAAIVANAIPSLVDAPPGLLTMLDLPLPRIT